MVSTDEVNTFLYDRLIVDIIHCLNDYIDNGRGTLEELIGSFRGSLPEEVRKGVQNVEQLVNALEEQSVIGKNNVKIIKLLAEKIGLQALVEKINDYEYDCSGFITKIFKGGAGAVKTSAIHLKAVLSSRGVQATVLTAAVLGVFGMNPQIVQNLQPFLDLRARLLALLQGSVVFVLKVSSIASIKRLWKGYKDGSLQKSMKKALNEMKELKELCKGEEIDVEVTIDEKEYRDVYWNLILSEVKANDARQNDEKQPTLLRRHSIGCQQDVPKSSNLPGGSQLHIQAWRHIDELNKVLSNFKSATGFEKVKAEEKAELTVIQEKVKSTDLGASTSFQAEEVEKQSDQATQVPHPDQMTHDEKLSDADVRKAGEKLEEQEGDKERMSEAQQLLLKERFYLFKNNVIPTELLDNLPCLTNEQKEQIAYDEKNYRHKSKAVETLVEKLKEHKEGFEQFVEALRKADLGHVAALLHAICFDISIIVRIKEQIKLEREIESKFSKTSSKEAKKLRQDFEKMLPGIYFVRTKLMKDVSAKDEGTKTTGAQDVPQSMEDSLAVVFRLNKIDLLDKLWEMYKDRRLDEVFRSVWSKELGSSLFELFIGEEDYIERKRILEEDVKAQSLASGSSSSGVKLVPRPAGVKSYHTYQRSPRPPFLLRVSPPPSPPLPPPPAGFITKIFTRVAGAVRSSAIHFWAVLSHGGAQATELEAAVLRVFEMNPETVQNIRTFLDLTAQVLALRQGSVVFVLKVSSIASIKRLWKGYKDGSLKKSMKKDLNEMKELKELSKGEEIDVEVTIDEEEYREVYWNLILSEMKVMHDKVERIDSGASTSLQAEKEKKQSDQSTQVPHPDQMTRDEKLSSAADVRKAGEKLEEQESFTQSIVAMRDKERMSKTQQLLLKECFSLFKDEIIPNELLDNLPCLTNEQKHQIAYDEKNQDFPSKAVETLAEKLKEHKEGFEQFVEALRKAELGHVAALLHANYVDIPIIVRIRGQMKSLEREIVSKFSNSFSKEAKKLRREFEKFRLSELGYMQKKHRSLFDMIPRGIYFVRTKLMEDVSAKDEGPKTTGAQDVPQSTEDSLAVVFRLNKINHLDQLWEMYKNRELEEVFRSVLWNELSSSAVHIKLLP